MELQTQQIRQDVLSGTTVQRGDTVVAVAAGQSLKIETSPGGEEILDVVCPDGASVRITVEITETQ